MGVSLTDIYAECNRLLLYDNAQALGILSAADRRAIIESAARIYSKKRPLLDLQAYNSTTTDWYALPTNFEDGFSELVNIEYAIELSPPSYIDNKYYGIDLMSDGKKIRFTSNNPAAGNTFWVRFTKRHEFAEAGTSDIPIVDETAYSFLVLSLWCDAFATHFASKADPNLPNAEAIEYKSRTEEYRSQAGQWLSKYNKELKDNYTGGYGEVGFIQDTYFDRSDD